MSDRKTRFQINLIALLAALGISGCGQDPTANTDPVHTDQHKLTDLKVMLQELAAENQPIPTSHEEMAAYEPFHPAAYLGIVRNEIHYQWGAKINAAAASNILAYEKKAPTEGGWVLMQDGTVKQMTAEEFKAAPKAPSASKAKR